eukprot:1182045-Prorocentrum_minimum.AAC.2
MGPEGVQRGSMGEVSYTRGTNVQNASYQRVLRGSGGGPAHPGGILCVLRLPCLPLPCLPRRRLLRLLLAPQQLQRVRDHVRTGEDGYADWPAHRRLKRPRQLRLRLPPSSQSVSQSVSQPARGGPCPTQYGRPSADARLRVRKSDLKRYGK